jgi:O-antigen ligase
MLMAWPATLALLRSGRWLLALVFAAATLATLLEYVSQSAALAALLGLAALPWGWVAPRLAAVGLALLVLVMGLFYPPWAPNGHEIAALHERLPAIKASGIHRLAIWSFTAERIEERPWLGWGMDAARAVPGGKRPVTAVMPEVKLPLTAEILPLHPHDAALQWRLELGLPGAVLCLVIFGSVLWRVGASARMPAAPRALAIGYAAGVLTVAMLSFGAWQAWWLSTVWLTASFFVGAQPRSAA